MRQTKVIIFGVGGVGSWAVEALVRTGVGHITMVDFDRVAPSNINRQLPATTLTVGELKVEAMRRRMLEINPQAHITAIAERYCEATADKFDLASYHYVIDAIDSVSDKALLILNATRAKPAKLFSSMGAALKCDPTKIAVTEFWKVSGCPLAAALRNKFKRAGIKPSRKFKCVYSPELLRNAVASPEGAPRVNGSLAHITGIFGFTLAGLIISDISNR